MVPLQVFAWYTLSALCFCELSIWASSEDARLGMIDHGRSYERSRLNERPIFLRTLFCYAAVVQSIVHMYYDDDRVKLPTSSASSQSSTLTQIRAILAPKAVHIPLRSLGLSISGLVVYFVFLRRAAFSAQYFIASKLYRIPKTRSFGIPGFVSLFTRYALHCLILLCIWEAANALCTVYLSKPPLKREQPLTNDSKDPNGSLISGLKGRKEFQKVYSFLEHSSFKANTTTEHGILGASVDHTRL